MAALKRISLVLAILCCSQIAFAQETTPTNAAEGDLSVQVENLEIESGSTINIVPREAERGTNIAWMLSCSALVLTMTALGFTFFRRKKNNSTIVNVGGSGHRARPKLSHCLFAVMLAAVAVVPMSAIAQDADTAVAEAADAAEAEVPVTLESLAESVAASAATDSFIFNTLLFLIGGFLVMWMAAGFAMLEAGLVQTKNVSMQCLKNIALFSVAGIMFWLVGYNLLYNIEVGAYFGIPGPYSWPAAGASTGGDYSVASDWFFQMVFCATTASIVSGTVAERIKFWPFIIFTILLTGFIYPVPASWEWGKGWLDVRGFSDFAGSTLVHSVGGWAALTGALILGARHGKYGKDGKVNPIVASNIPLATLGTFILWLGWFGFNGASQLAMGTISDAADVSRIFANTNLAACGGVVMAIILTQLLYRKIDVTMALNGALAGLVAITAEPLAPGPLASIIIGGVGGCIVVFTVPLLDKLKIDDVVGAIPVHLVAGIFGTLVVAAHPPEGVSIGKQLMEQAIGVVATGVFVCAVSAIIWYALKFTIGIRVSEQEELIGLDKGEVGVAAYPEFVN
jgi:Amt family ammonium transporter